MFDVVAEVVASADVTELIRWLYGNYVVDEVYGGVVVDDCSRCVAIKWMVKAVAVLQCCRRWLYGYEVVAWRCSGVQCGYVVVEVVV